MRSSRAKGWQAEVESGEARADVVLAAEGERIAVEIALSGGRHEAINVPKDLQEFDQVWVVSPEEHVLAQAERSVRGTLDEDAGKRVRFILFTELLKESGTKTG